MTGQVAKLQQVGGETEWVAIALAEASKLQEKTAGKIASLNERVAEARSAWSKVLFPSPRLESWKYTNPEQIAKGPFVLASSTGSDAEVAELITRSLVKGLESTNTVVFVDGVFSAKHSRVAQANGLQVTRLLDRSDAASRIGMLDQHRGDAFAALATALLSDCVCVSVARGCVVETPVQIVHVVTSACQGAVVTPRVFVEAAENAKVTVVESHIGASAVRYLSLPMAELVAEPGAFIDYYKMQVESEDAFHVAGVTASQARNSEIRTHLFEFGGALVRNNAQVLLKGSGAQAVLNGLSLLRDSQHIDNATLIHHIEPHAESREHFKGIYGGSSKGVFSGTITVEKIAQKTNAFQSNQALLLSTDASIESRPQLKIWADDVKCTHGATIGQLDADALFYLRSRGIGRQEAQAFLVHAFASEVLLSVNVASLKQHVEEIISQKLQQVLG